MRNSPTSRRRFLGQGALGAACFAVPGRFAEELLRTPTITEGPFYPDKLPLDTDNDLLVLNDSITPAVGEITFLSGRVLSRSGLPVRNAFVEIWQVDKNGSYLHKGGRIDGKWDENFQGYGRFMTDSKGRYHFRTIKPVPYMAGPNFLRAPHIHVAVSKNGRRLLTTQLLINGHKHNARDGLFNAVRDPLQRETVLAEFAKIPGSKLGELQVNWDIVLGHTLVEENGKLGVSKSRRAGAKSSEGARHRFDRSQSTIDRYLSLDRDGDGKLGLKEVSPRMRSLVLRADHDKDGAASKDELLGLLGLKRG